MNKERIKGGCHLIFLEPTPRWMRESLMRDFREVLEPDGKPFFRLSFRFQPEYTMVRWSNTADKRNPPEVRDIDNTIQKLAKKGYKITGEEK